MNGAIAVPSVKTINATPKVRGSIVQTYLYEDGTGYGSTTTNNHKKPSISIENGRNGSVVPNIKNGQITSVNINFGGNEYFSVLNSKEISNKIKDLGLENDLITHEGLTPGMLVTLGEQKILTLVDFADLASDELTGGFDVIKGEKVKIKGYLEEFALSKAEADQLIMTAREKVYKD